MPTSVHFQRILHRPVTELDTAIRTLRPAPRPPTHRIALHFCAIFFVYRSIRSPKPVQGIYLRPRIPDDSCRHAHPTLSFLDPAPSHPFSFIVHPLAECAFTVFANDTFHSSAVLGTFFLIAEVICLPGLEERKQHQILLVSPSDHLVVNYSNSERLP